MCGRFVQIDATITRLQTIREFQIRVDSYAPHRHRLESYNVAPQRMVMVIKAANGQLELDEMLWGIKPKWAKDRARHLINARSEGISEKTTFRRLLNQKIAVPAEGFYEWKGGGAPGLGSRPKKTPYYFYRTDGDPVLMAGLFQRSADPDTGELIETFVILTTAANSMMSPYHDRMPVIVEPAQLSEWLLKETDASLLERITSPPPNEILTTHRVSNRVNSSRTEGYELIEEVREAESPGRSSYD